MDWPQPDASTGKDNRQVLDDINNELALLNLRGDELRKQMTSLHFWNDPIGNRRVQQPERRVQAERRKIVRPDGDRRSAASDRRLPLKARCQALETEIEQVSQRSRELNDIRRKLHRT